MSCYSCLTKFSIFTKELSCPKCNFSFCNNCLKQKAFVDDEEKNVCQNCYKKLTTSFGSESARELDTPDLLLKRLETLENPAKPPITIFRHSARLTNLKYGLSSEDKKILERLEKLKADHTVSILPDENEIKRRLALLQDRSVESISRPEKVDATPKLPEEEVDELLNQYINETNIQTNLEASRNMRTDDIETRLRKLQMSESTAMNTDISNQTLEEGDSETEKIVKRAIAEAQLERRYEESVGKNEDSDISDMDDDDDDDDEESEAELPWCIICNQNADIKCFGCSGSLYCKACFEQGHDFFNMKDHKFTSYVKKDTNSES